MAQMPHGAANSPSSSADAARCWQREIKRRQAEIVADTRDAIDMPGDDDTEYFINFTIDVAPAPKARRY